MYLSSGQSFCRMRRTSCTMDGYRLIYLLMILLIRSGDVETNPGPDRSVSEKEFLKLSKQIEPSYYKEVGINLDISIAELGHIKERSQNTSDALMTVFTRWRDKQPPGTDIRALLAEELKRSELGSLAGSLIPKQTGAPVTMPGSETQPLSPDLIKRCADDFKSKYRKTLCKIRADPLDPDSIEQFKDMYTNLVLKEKYRNCKRLLEYKDLFDLKVNGEFPKRIMIEGEAGAGKTTFCSKIAWDWINDSPVLPKFVWVLVVPLCEAKQYTIGEIAKSYLSKENPATVCQINGYIRSNPKDVFIAFDGLDEVEFLQPKSADQIKARSESKMKKNNRPNLMQLKSSNPTSATLQPRVNSAEASGSSSERGDIALLDILRSDELDACSVLVTSRPRKAIEITRDKCLRKLYTFIYVEGFSKENVEVYIHKYFEDDMATADQLIQLTKDNDIISKFMAPHPIYISMLCLMWRELGDEKQEKFKSFRTFSQIFDERFKFLRVHYAQKIITDLDSPSFKEYLSQMEKLMKPVAEVAFIGLQQNTTFFKEDDFEHCSESLETACRVGVLEERKSFINDKSSIYLQSEIFFPHKLFQEYMAGVYLASLYVSNHNKFKRLMKQVVLPSMEDFRHLLYFTVSRDKTIANHVMKRMVYGRWYDQEDMDFLVDVSFESQDLDTAALLRGRVSSLAINPFMTAHTIAGYIFTGLYKDVVQTVVLLDVMGSTSASLHHLAEALCSMPDLTDLALSGKVFHEEFYSTLNENASTLQVQRLSLIDVMGPTSAFSHYLAEALCSMPNLTDLALIDGKVFQEEFYSTLYKEASNLQDQETIMLWDKSFPTSIPSHHLGEDLYSMPSLTVPTPHGKVFHEKFYSTLNAKASTLQVQTLKLFDVGCPTSASSHHLAEALSSMPNLTDLTLSGKVFHEEFYSSLNAKVLTLQLKGRTLRVHQYSDYLKPKDNEELDDATKMLREEECAPETPPTSDKEDEQELVLPTKGHEIPAKKKKKSKKDDCSTDIYSAKRDNCSATFAPRHLLQRQLLRRQLLRRQLPLERQLLRRHLLCRHLLCRQMLCRHLLHRHLLRRHLLCRHLLCRHLLRRHLPRRHLLRRHLLRRQMLRRQMLRRQLLRRQLLRMKR